LSEKIFVHKHCYNS